MPKSRTIEYCAICGCVLHRRAGTYARATLEGRSHATRHHYVAERFFGRSANRRGTQLARVFEVCPWGLESQRGVFCYECHEELLHNPVLLPEDIAKFRELVERHGFAESTKSESRDRLAGRVRLLRKVIAHGLDEMLRETQECSGPRDVDTCPHVHR